MSEDHRPVVLLAINSLAGGGAERVFATILAASASRRPAYRLHVALLDDEPDAYALPDWVDVTRLDCGGSLWRSVAALRALARRLRPAVGCAFLTRANIAMVIAQRAIGRPVVISERVNTSAHLATSRMPWLSKALVRRYYRKADRILAVSAGVGDTLERDFGVSPDRLGVVYNPVDIEHIRNLGRAEPTMMVGPDDVVAMGRLVRNKNFKLAIDAFARARASGRLILLGEGPMRDELGAHAAALGIADRVTIPGFQQNPYAIIARAGLFLLSSNAEGFPNALVEAMALGLPVCATDCRSGPAEILGVSQPPVGGYLEGSGGLLVPPDDREAMIAAITALDDPALRTRIVASGAVRVADFTLERAVEGFWSALSALAHAPKSIAA